MIVAIDGGVASGKSAVGKRVADALGLPFIDSGLMYRAITRLATDSRPFERLPHRSTARRENAAPNSEGQSRILCHVRHETRQRSAQRSAECS